MMKRNQQTNGNRHYTSNDDINNEISQDFESRVQLESAEDALNDIGCEDTPSQNRYEEILRKPNSRKQRQKQEDFGDRAYQTERNPRGAQNNNQILPNTNKQQVWIKQKNLQLQFLEEENLNLKKQVRDIEQSVKINKDMLSLLLSDAKEFDSKNQKLMMAMNLENQQLLARARHLIEQRNQVSDDLLIATQIIEDFGAKEQDLNDLHNEQMENIVDQLQRKEQKLQFYELKMFTYEKFLQRKAIHDSESKQILQKFYQENPLTSDKISNVVEQNLNLKEQMKEMLQDNNKLKIQIQEMESNITALTNQINNQQQPDQKFGLTLENDQSIFDQTNISLANIEKEVNFTKLRNMEKYFPQEYKVRLEILLMELLKRLQAVISEKTLLKKQNNFLHENFTQCQQVLSKVNHAMTKATSRIKVLEDKLVESGYNIQPSNFQQVFEFKSKFANQIDEQNEDGDLMFSEQLINENDAKIISQLSNKLQQLTEMHIDSQQFGNVSSIIINHGEITSNAINTSCFNPYPTKKVNDDNNYSFSFVGGNKQI